MKTIREWLECLPEPYKRQALANAKLADTLDDTGATTKEGALMCAFDWTCSPEGYQYWESPFKKAFVGLYDPPPTNALSAIHAIALKKGFPVEEIMSVQQDEGIPDMWYYTLKGNSKVHNISLSND